MLLLFSCSLFSQVPVYGIVKSIPPVRPANINKIIPRTPSLINQAVIERMFKPYDSSDFMVSIVAQSRTSLPIHTFDKTSFPELKTLKESIKQIQIIQTIEPSVIMHNHPTAHDRYNPTDISSTSFVPPRPPRPIPNSKEVLFPKPKALSEYKVPIALGFEPTLFMPLHGLSEFKNPRDEVKLRDFAENNDDCLKDTFCAPKVSPDAIIVVKKEQDYLVNNKPTDNPSDDLVNVLRQKEVSTFVEILFESETDYSSLLDLDKIEQNTNLDIEHCVASYYRNGSVLVQIPVMSKSLMNPFLKFWENLKSRFSPSTKKSINKSKTGEDKDDFIKKEFEGIKYLENNIINEYYDYFLEEQTAA